MKILKLSSYFFPEQIASSHLTSDLNNAYAEAGIFQENFVPVPTRGVSDDVRRKYKKIRREVLYDGKLVLHRFPMFREGKSPVQRAIRYVLVQLIQYEKGVKAKDIDVVIGGSTPPTQGVLCAMVKKRLSKKYKVPVPFIYVLQDIFPDSLVNAKMTKHGSMLFKIGSIIERYIYKAADKIIVISEDFKRNIMSKGVPEDKILVIPNWVDTEKVYPVKREDNILFTKYDLDVSKFYVCYSGNIGHSQNIPLLLEVAKKLKAELPVAHIVIIGEGAAKEKLVGEIDDKQLDNITVLPFQPYEDIAHVFSLGDAGLIISKSGIGGSSVPSKTWSILAAERPIIASFDSDSELCKLVNVIGCGIIAEADKVEPLIAAIRMLHASEDVRMTMGKKGRRYLSENLGRDKCTSQYVEVIKSFEKHGS